MKIFITGTMDEVIAKMMLFISEYGKDATLATILAAKKEVKL